MFSTQPRIAVPAVLSLLRLPVPAALPWLAWQLPPPAWKQGAFIGLLEVKGKVGKGVGEGKVQESHMASGSGGKLPT